MFLLLTLFCVVSVVSAQYPNYYFPQSYGYGNFPGGGYGGGYPFGQYGQFGQYGYPMQMQQPYYTASQTFNGGQQVPGASTVTAAQTTTATVPNPPMMYPNQGFVLGNQAVIPQQVYQTAVPVAGAVAQQPPPQTSVVQSNTVVEMEEPPPSPPGHFDYYAYGRDGLPSKVERRYVRSRRPFQTPKFIRSGSPIKVTKPEHFEYTGYARSAAAPLIYISS